MIKAKIIPKVLEQVKVDFCSSGLLMLDDGSVLGTTGINDPHVTAAILSNLWQDYEQAGNKVHAGKLKIVMIDCEAGKFGSIRIGNGYIAAVGGNTNVQSEVIKANLMRLFDYFDPLLREFESAPQNTEE